MSPLHGRGRRPQKFPIATRPDGHAIVVELLCLLVTIGESKRRGGERTGAQNGVIIIILAYTARSRIIIILAYLAGLFLLRRIGKIGGYGIVYSRPLLYERTALKKLRLSGEETAWRRAGC